MIALAVYALLIIGAIKVATTAMRWQSAIRDGVRAVLANRPPPKVAGVRSGKRVRRILGQSDHADRILQDWQPTDPNEAFERKPTVYFDPTSRTWNQYSNHK